MQVLYVDTLFFSNMAMDLLALSVTGVILRLKRSFGMLLLASALGGVYAVVAVLLAFPLPLHMIVSLLLSLCLVAVAFGRIGRGRLFFGAVVLFYLATVLFGGGIELLFVFLEQLFGTRTHFFLSVSDMVLLLGTLIFVILRLVIRFFFTTPVTQSATVQIRFRGHKITVPLLVDTGCLLADPITGTPALLLSREAALTIFPKELTDCAVGKIRMPETGYLSSKCRLLVASSMGEKKLLLAVRADRVTLVIQPNTPLDVLIALWPEEGEDFGGFAGLIPSGVLLGKMQKEKRRTV